MNASPVEITKIPLNCLYNDDQTVRDSTDPLYIKFLNECGRVVDGIIVRIAVSMNLCHIREVKSRAETFQQRVQCISHQDVARHFTQLDVGMDRKTLEDERKKLVDILLTYFRHGWELEYEKVVLNRLGYEYDNHNLKELNMRKGDVSKLLTAKHRDRVKEILRKIREVHGKGKFDITRKRGVNDGDYDRRAREKNVIYMLDNPYERKVRYNMFMLYKA